VTLKEAIDSAVRGYLYRVLSDARGNAARAARVAGVSKQNFYRVLRRYGIVTGRMREAREASEASGFRTLHGGGRRPGSGRPAQAMPGPRN
jgi:hypothetical protein